MIICRSAQLHTEGIRSLCRGSQTALGIPSTLHSGHLVNNEVTTYPGYTEDIMLLILESANCAHPKFSRGARDVDEVFIEMSRERFQFTNNPPRPYQLPKIVAGADQFGAELTSDLYSMVFKRVVSVESILIAGTIHLLVKAHSSTNSLLASEVMQKSMGLVIDLVH